MMEALIIILIVAMLYFVIGRKCPDEWSGEDIDGGTYGYGKKMTIDTKAVKKRTRKSTTREKKLPKVTKKKTSKRKAKPKKRK